jgi:hypothetical protein
VTPGLERSAFELRPSSQPIDSSGKVIPTLLMERVSELLETTTKSLSRNEVQKSVTGKETMVGKALDHLVAEGFLTESAGPRNGRYYTSKRPYRQDKGVRVQTAKAATEPGKGFGGGATAGRWAATDPF